MQVLKAAEQARVHRGVWHQHAVFGMRYLWLWVAQEGRNAARAGGAAAVGNCTSSNSTPVECWLGWVTLTLHDL